jgi:hypothetical protein
MTCAFNLTGIDEVLEFVNVLETGSIPVKLKAEVIYSFYGYDRVDDFCSLI